MIDTGVLRDEGMIYFDARLSHRYPTVEVRVADVCLQVSDAVLLAALVRGLVETAAREWRANLPPAPYGTELLRLATWRAARSGLEGRLLHPRTMRPEPAEAVMWALFSHVGPALTEYGEVALVRERLAQVLERGTGARVQRNLLTRTGSLCEVVAECVRRTDN